MRRAETWTSHAEHEAGWFVEVLWTWGPDRGGHRSPLPISLMFSLDTPLEAQERIREHLKRVRVSSLGAGDAETSPDRSNESQHGTLPWEGPSTFLEEES